MSRHSRSYQRDDDDHLWRAWSPSGCACRAAHIELNCSSQRQTERHQEEQRLAASSADRQQRSLIVQKCRYTQSVNQCWMHCVWITQQQRWVTWWFWKLYFQEYWNNSAGKICICCNTYAVLVNDTPKKRAQWPLAVARKFLLDIPIFP